MDAERKTQLELVAVINACYDAVARSRIGPVFEDKMRGQFNGVALQTFLTVLAKMLPNQPQEVTHTTPRERWEEA